MPRETIHGPTDESVVKVGWSDHAVQVGVELNDTRRITIQGVEIRTSETSTTPETYRGVWANLDREQINRLIRVLRTARDKAYGRDE